MQPCMAEKSNFQCSFINLQLHTNQCPKDCNILPRTYFSVFNKFTEGDVEDKLISYKRSAVLRKSFVTC